VSSEREEERGRGGQGHSTDGDKLRRPTMVRRPEFQAAARARGRRGAGARVKVS
jgi:hypothetical protein